MSMSFNEQFPGKRFFTLNRIGIYIYKNWNIWILERGHRTRPACPLSASGFTAPESESATPLKTTDCRLDQT